MISDNFSLAMIDFQDAVIGPVTYDLVSLLKDCYVDLSPLYCIPKQIFSSKIIGKRNIRK